LTREQEKRTMSNNKAKDERSKGRTLKELEQEMTAKKLKTEETAKKQLTKTTQEEIMPMTTPTKMMMMMKQIEDHETKTKSMMTETETQTRINMTTTQPETMTTKTEMKTTVKMMKKEAAALRNLYTQYYYGWLGWAEEFKIQASYYLPAHSPDWKEAVYQARLCSYYAEQAIFNSDHLEMYPHIPIPCDELPPAPPPPLYEEDDDGVPDDESDYDDTDDDDDDYDDTDDQDDDNNDDLLELEYYELEAATKGPPTELLRYVERCHATCSTPELHSAMDSVLQTTIEQMLLAGKLYTSDWDNQPLIQVTSTTDETAPQHEAPPTLTRPCPHIVNDTSEVDNNMDKANALPADTHPWDVAETNVNLVPDPVADIISHPKPTTVAAALPLLPSNGTEPAAYLFKLPSYGTEHVVDTHPLITLDPGGAWHKPVRTPSPDTMELAWHQPPKQKMKSKKMMMDASGKHSNLGCQSPHFQVFHLLLRLLPPFSWSIRGL
jgi:hypothetical protein